MNADVLIVGGGPAACSAALTMINRGRSVIMAYVDEGALGKAREVITNYPGMEGMTGAEMLEKMRAQVKRAGAEMIKGSVRQIISMGDSYAALIGQDYLTAKGVILCCGTLRGGAIPGEADLMGQGVSYCATCDGMLYRKKKIAVILGDENEQEEVDFLTSICEVVCYAEKPGMTLSSDVRHEKILGIKDGPVLVTEQGETPYACIFILRSATPLRQLMTDLETGENGRIRVDKNMKTSLPRVYAAGDMTGAPYQIAAAVGEGNIAAIELDKELRAGR